MPPQRRLKQYHFRTLVVKGRPRFEKCGQKADSSAATRVAAQDRTIHEARTDVPDGGALVFEMSNASQKFQASSTRPKNAALSEPSLK